MGFAYTEGATTAGQLTDISSPQRVAYFDYPKGDSQFIIDKAEEQYHIIYEQDTFWLYTSNLVGDTPTASYKELTYHISYVDETYDHIDFYLNPGAKIIITPDAATILNSLAVATGRNVNKESDPELYNHLYDITQEMINENGVSMFKDGDKYVTNFKNQDAYFNWLDQIWEVFDRDDPVHPEGTPITHDMIGRTVDAENVIVSESSLAELLTSAWDYWYDEATVTHDNNGNLLPKDIGGNDPDQYAAFPGALAGIPADKEYTGYSDAFLTLGTIVRQRYYSVTGENAKSMAVYVFPHYAQSTTDAPTMHIQIMLASDPLDEGSRTIAHLDSVRNTPNWYGSQYSECRSYIDGEYAGVRLNVVRTSTNAYNYQVFNYTVVGDGSSTVGNLREVYESGSPGANCAFPCFAGGGMVYLPGVGHDLRFASGVSNHYSRTQPRQRVFLPSTDPSVTPYYIKDAFKNQLIKNPDGSLRIPALVGSNVGTLIATGDGQVKAVTGNTGINPATPTQNITNITNGGTTIINKGTDPYDPPNVNSPDKPDYDQIGGFTTVYDIGRIPSETQPVLDAIGDAIWTEDFFAELVASNTNPMECIIGYYYIPMKFTTEGHLRAIVLGKYNCHTPSATASNPFAVGDVVTNQYAEKTFAAITVPEIYHSALDYDGASCTIYLPYIGFKELEPFDVIGATIEIKYVCDVYTGDCIVFVSNKKEDSSLSYTIASYTGNMATRFPLTGQDRSGWIAAGLGAVTSLASGIATGNIAGGVGGAAASLLSGNTKISMASDIKSNTGAMGIQYPYIIVKRRRVIEAGSEAKYIGKPANYTRTIGSCSGYTRFRAINLDGIKATEAEKERLKQKLLSGVYIK